MNLTGVRIEAKEDYQIDKDEFIALLEKWKKEGVLEI